MGFSQLVLPLVVPAPLVMLRLVAPDTVPSMWPQGRDEVVHLGKLLQRLRLRVCVRLRTCWLSYSCRVILYPCLVLVVWLWFGCSMVVVVGGRGCWRL